MSVCTAQGNYKESRYLQPDDEKASGIAGQALVKEESAIAKECAQLRKAHLCDANYRPTYIPCNHVR